MTKRSWQFMKFSTLSGSRQANLWKISQLTFASYLDIWRVTIWRIATNSPNSPIFSPSKYFLCIIVGYLRHQYFTIQKLRKCVFANILSLQIFPMYGTVFANFVPFQIFSKYSYKLLMCRINTLTEVLVFYGSFIKVMLTKIFGGLLK